MIRLRDKAASTSSPPLHLTSASRREDRPEVTLPPQKRLGIDLGPRYEVGESSSAAAARPAGEIMRDPEREVGYGNTDSWDEIVETLQGAPVSTDTEVGGYMREFETRVRQDTDEIYMRLDDEQTERQLLAGRLNMLFMVRRQTVISELRRTDHRRSIEITELRTALQGQVTALQGHVTALQAQHEMLSGVRMAMIAVIPEQVLEGQNELLVNVLTLTFLSVNHYLSKTVGHETTYGMSWKTLMKMMTEKYYPRNEIRKLEMELWDLKEDVF
nr:hypothetical protein [Tanacetum cinerariifolium]